jgi:hypothetical protein
VVVPVTFVLDGDDLLVRARLGSTERVVLQPEVVAFETGGPTADGIGAWEVLVQGRAATELDTQRGEPTGHWPPQLPFVGDAMSTVLRVQMERVTGWRYGVTGADKEVVGG